MRSGTCMWCSNTNPFKFKLTMSLWECGAQRNGHLFKAKLQSSCQTGLQLPYGNLVRRFSGGSLWGTWALLMWNHFGTILLKLLLGFVSILWLHFPTVRNWSLLPSMATKWMFTRMLRWVRWKCCAGVRIYHSNIRPWHVTSCFVSIHRTLPVTTPTQIWWPQSLRESKIWWTQTKLFHGASSSSSCSCQGDLKWLNEKHGMHIYTRNYFCSWCKCCKKHQDVRYTLGDMRETALHRQTRVSHADFLRDTPPDASDLVGIFYSECWGSTKQYI